MLKSSVFFNVLALFLGALAPQYFIAVRKFTKAHNDIAMLVGKDNVPLKKTLVQGVGGLFCPRV